MRQEGKCGKLLGSLAAEGIGARQAWEERGPGTESGVPHLGLLRRVPVRWASASLFKCSAVLMWPHLVSQSLGGRGYSSHLVSLNLSFVNRDDSTNFHRISVRIK